MAFFLFTAERFAVNASCPKYKGKNNKINIVFEVGSYSKQKEIVVTSHLSDYILERNISKLT